MRGWTWGDDVGPLAELIARGGILAIPTESSYGLAVDPRSTVGVEAVYAVKERQRRRPLPVVAGDLGQVAALGIDVEAPAVRAVAALWPAPLTAVLPTRERLPAAAGAAGLGVRMPAHRALRRLLLELGTPLTATSANLSGSPPVLEPSELAPLLADRDALVVEGGRLPGGPPSTMIAWQGGEWRLLREGRFPLARLGHLLGPATGGGRR
ncbi:MAG TPA: L-threonylcarbamoyladenylate synthase [Thermoanaerobaculia bacterium]|nr:L-threonylcarbamoyladenylate synthase [Thermoanaerobaculia bacterium]